MSAVVLELCCFISDHHLTMSSHAAKRSAWNDSLDELPMSLFGHYIFFAYPNLSAKVLREMQNILYATSRRHPSRLSSVTAAQSWAADDHNSSHRCNAIKHYYRNATPACSCSDLRAHFSSTNTGLSPSVMVTCPFETVFVSASKAVEKSFIAFPNS